MVCDICKTEISDTVFPLHIQRCKPIPEVIKTEDIVPPVEEPKNDVPPVEEPKIIRSKGKSR